MVKRKSKVKSQAIPVGEHLETFLLIKGEVDKAKGIKRSNKITQIADSLFITEKQVETLLNTLSAHSVNPVTPQDLDKLIERLPKRSKPLKKAIGYSSKRNLRG